MRYTTKMPTTVHLKFDTIYWPNWLVKIKQCGVVVDSFILTTNTFRFEPRINMYDPPRTLNLRNK